jgi:glycosyltransferase involved in cell wall biosynthesis
MKTKLPVSLVLPCFNRPRQTKALLQSISQADFECELIVIDDASKEPLIMIIDQFPHLAIVYHRNECNRGPAYSRNKGIALASHDYIAFTDNDCTVAHDWLIRLHEYISSAKGKVAAVGGKVISKGADLFSHYYTYHKILDPWYHNGQYFYVVTANAIFKKAALLEVGGFDEDIRKAGGEDPGLCFKLMKNGWRFLYNKEAIIVHEYESGFRRLFRTFFNYGYGCSLQTQKHFQMPLHPENGNFGGMEVADH